MTFKPFSGGSSRGGYTRETMLEILTKLESVLEKDGEELGEHIQRHVENMIRDCRAYAFGGGDQRKWYLTSIN